METKACPVGYETPHCYMSVTNKELVRGCVSDELYHEVLSGQCIDEMGCFFCDGENCNYFSSPFISV